MWPSRWARSRILPSLRRRGRSGRSGDTRGCGFQTTSNTRTSRRRGGALGRVFRNVPRQPVGRFREQRRRRRRSPRLPRPRRHRLRLRQLGGLPSTERIVRPSLSSSIVRAGSLARLTHQKRTSPGRWPLASSRRSPSRGLKLASASRIRDPFAHTAHAGDASRRIVVPLFPTGHRGTLELLEHMLHRRVVADRVVNSALVVVAYNDDGAVAEPSSLPQTPRPLSAFVHCGATIDRVRVGLNHPLADRSAAQT